ncbi:MAG TPA: flavodoxin [Candidatus Anaerotruncus excrementipullorum]|uniref:Flavodoxin n=1 Tax=Candidatus Anaerotruncus excrementipullorum TaxID=2838465 RepID=A0A9D1WQV2_9FIRM|nr:flavodoxin [Candidatus Anaerotruncus excrementipullorum]
MKIAICYYSAHHGNTRKLVQTIALAEETAVFDLSAQPQIRLEEYDCVGFASGIYGFAIHPSVVEFARQQLPQGMPVFFVYTYGLRPGTGTRALEELAAQRGCPVWGEFSCRGYTTYGPLKLLGGAAKGHPDEEDLAAARVFYREILKKQEEFSGGNCSKQSDK